MFQVIYELSEAHAFTRDRGLEPHESELAQSSNGFWARSFIEYQAQSEQNKEHESKSFTAPRSL